MTLKFTGTYTGKQKEDSGNESPDYYVYKFKNIIGDDGKEYPGTWIKETKLMRNYTFIIGEKYDITLSSNYRHPIKIEGGKGEIYIKGGNSIIKIGKDGNEENLSTPRNKILGTNNYETAALNKFEKGLLTEDLLKKMNARGLFFRVHYYDPFDGRKGIQNSYGLSRDITRGNYILIERKTQGEIDKDLENIRSSYLCNSIEKYFNITTELLKSKKPR